MARESMRQILEGAAPFDPIPRPRLLENNTVEFYREGRRIIKLHSTEILEWSRDGKRCKINSGGWQTVTTKDRINCYSPVSVYSQKGLWYIGETLFFDGIEIVDGKPPKPVLSREQKAQKLADSIRKFVARMDKLEVLPMPDSGDCLLCAMDSGAVENNSKSDYGVGNSTGRRVKSKHHIAEHIREGYLHGRLIFNALKWSGATDYVISLAFREGRDNFARPMAKRAMRRFLRSQLGLPV